VGDYVGDVIHHAKIEDDRQIGGASGHMEEISGSRGL